MFKAAGCINCEKIGTQRVIWRYDPIFLNSRYTLEYHLIAFEEIARSLAGYTRKVVISFVDLYAKTQRNTVGLQIKSLSEQDMIKLAKQIVTIAKGYGMEVESCAEMIDLQSVGVKHGSCIDKKLIEEIIGCKLIVGKDKNQRSECGCYESVETGTYNTCKNGCRYCYANFNDAAVLRKLHPPLILFRIWNFRDAHKSKHLVEIRGVLWYYTRGNLYAMSESADVGVSRKRRREGTACL